MTDPWRIEAVEFPATGSGAEKLAFFLGYAVLATSLYNAQPWRFRIRDAQLDVFADRSRELPEADPQGRQLIISCGALLFNLCVAARGHYCELAMQRFPDAANPDWLARVTLAGEARPSSEESALVRAIPKRRTHHKQFEEGRLSQSLLAELKRAVSEQGAELVYAQDSGIKSQVAELVANVERALMAEPAFVAERERWLRAGPDASQDGIPRSYLYGLSELPGYGAPEWSLEVGAPETPEFWAERTRRVVEGSPVLALLATPGDSVPSWLQAGEAMKHAVLLARDAGIWAAYFNQAIQIPASRSILRTVMGAQGYPQVLVGLGPGCEPPRTGRRGISEVLRE